MPTLEMPKVELIPMTLPSEDLTKVGHSSPPLEHLQRERRPAERLPRDLRETRRHMTYHWF